MQSEYKADRLFHSVRSVYITLAAYVNKVGMEIGKEKALDILSKTFTELGVFQGTKLKRNLDGEKVDASKAFNIIKEVPKNLGINFMIPQQDVDKATTRLDKCPIYESATVVGLDPSEFCDNTAVQYFDAVAKQLNGDLIFERSKMKTAEKDFCEEQLVLKK